jgi:hypothetical protein
VGTVGATAHEHPPHQLQHQLKVWQLLVALQRAAEQVANPRGDHRSMLEGRGADFAARPLTIVELLVPNTRARRPR